MKKKILMFVAIAALLCGQISYAQTAIAEPQENRATDAVDEKEAPAETVVAGPTPVAIADGMATLSPANTKVEFVGVHLGDKPDPRLGGFSSFKGHVKMADDGKTISGMQIEFQTDSLWTTIPDLTKHLKNADFFNVSEHPTAKFQSTKVAAGDQPGMTNITGNLTLMGETKEIMIPAMATTDDKGVLMKSAFKLDRTMFGMSKMTNRVSPEVSLTFSVGEKTKGAGKPANARPAAGKGGPMGFFKRMDADGDGKLSGDEIPERMKGRLETIDTDGDGSVTLEEMQEMMKKFRGGGQSGGNG